MPDSKVKPNILGFITGGRYISILYLLLIGTGVLIVMSNILSHIAINSYSTELTNLLDISFTVNTIVYYVEMAVFVLTLLGLFVFKKSFASLDINHLKYIAIIWIMFLVLSYAPNGLMYFANPESDSFSQIFSLATLSIVLLSIANTFLFYAGYYNWRREKNIHLKTVWSSIQNTFVQDGKIVGMLAIRELVIANYLFLITAVVLALIMRTVSLIVSLVWPEVDFTVGSGLPMFVAILYLGGFWMAGVSWLMFNKKDYALHKRHSMFMVLMYVAATVIDMVMMYVAIEANEIAEGAYHVITFAGRMFASSAELILFYTGYCSFKRGRMIDKSTISSEIQAAFFKKTDQLETKV